jgi:DNA polymerase III alpha subunit
MSNKLVKFNQLELRKFDDVKHQPEAPQSEAPSNGDTGSVDEQINEEQLTSRFVRSIPDEPAYTERLRRELDMIIGKNLAHNILLALDVLEMTKNMPHVTRGSCGSSLVCYLLGISHVDPVKYDISFSRFLSQYRSNLPDIDFDFPHALRDEVFLKLQLKWPGKIARISNHIHFHKKSAIRQALRDNGVSGFVGKYEINEKLRKLDASTRKQVLDDAGKLEDTFRGYSLHCGGVVFFAEGIPEELKMPGSHGIIGQVTLNKEDVARDKNFKIDILSSRALSQLYMANLYRPIDFYANHDDVLTSQLISRGDNIGITLAESPLMRKAMLKLRPKCLDDVAACMAIIRPTAKEARDSIIPVSLKNHIVYDDDAIRFIQEVLDCEEDLADKYRRAFAKGDTKVINELKKTLPKEKHPVLKKLHCLRKYGFCKAHAYSYAQLVWQLAYCKAHRPVQFWKAALKNCNSFYRRWVHLYEASRAGVDVASELAKEQTSIYAEARSRKTFDTPLLDQLRDYGYWKMDGDRFIPGCYLDDDDGGDSDVPVTATHRQERPGRRVKYSGIIACSRILDLDPGKESTVVMSLGIGNGRYIEVTVTGRIPNVAKMVGCKGRGILFDETTLSIQSNSFKFF